MTKENASRFIFSIFAVMAMLLVWSLGVNAAHADTVSAQISLAANGQTMIRDATVVAVSGTQITVETAWGATTLQWIIETTGSTKFSPEGSSRDMLKAMKKGDRVSITGTLEMNNRSTVRASVVRNLSHTERLSTPSVTAPQPEAEEPAGAPSGATSSSSSEEDDTLIVSATGTALLSWLWRFLYGDPSLAMAG